MSIIIILVWPCYIGYVLYIQIGPQVFLFCVFIYSLFPFYFTGIESYFWGLVKEKLFERKDQRISLRKRLWTLMLHAICALLCHGVGYSFLECCNVDGGHYKPLRDKTRPDQYCIPTFGLSRLCVVTWAILTDVTVAVFWQTAKNYFLKITSWSFFFPQAATHMNVLYS